MFTSLQLAYSNNWGGELPILPNAFRTLAQIRGIII